MTQIQEHKTNCINTSATQRSDYVWRFFPHLIFLLQCDIIIAAVTFTNGKLLEIYTRRTSTCFSYSWMTKNKKNLTSSALLLYYTQHFFCHPFPIRVSLVTPAKEYRKNAIRFVPHNVYMMWEHICFYTQTVCKIFINKSIYSVRFVYNNVT